MRLLVRTDHATGKRFVDCRSPWLSDILGVAGEHNARSAQVRKSWCEYRTLEAGRADAGIAGMADQSVGLGLGRGWGLFGE